MKLMSKAAAVAALVVAAVVALGRARRRDEERTAARGDLVPPSARGREELVDTALEDSFPASDPPSYWARGTEA